METMVKPNAMSPKSCGASRCARTIVPTSPRPRMSRPRAPHGRNAGDRAAAYGVRGEALLGDRRLVASPGPTVLTARRRVNGLRTSLAGSAGGYDRRHALPTPIRAPRACVERRRRSGAREPRRRVSRARAERVATATMTSTERMHALYQAINYATDAGVRGAVVECGVWRGGSSMLSALALLARGRHVAHALALRHVRGNASPGELDVTYDGVPAHALLATQERTANAVNDWCVAPIEQVRANMDATGYPRERIRLVEGKVEDTIPVPGARHDRRAASRHRLVRVHVARTGSPVSPPRPGRRSHRRRLRLVEGGT